MAEENKKPPFQSFAFTLIENKRPRTAFRLTAGEGGLYDLNVQKGSAANPSSQVTRQVPQESAERLRDALQRIGAFGWEEAYGDASAPGSRRWTLSIVFEEGVFTLESKGGSDVPAGFDDLLEELYRLDFPRPAESSPAEPLATFAPLGDLPNMNSAELEQRLRTEVRRMGPAERSQLIDQLVQLGMGTRKFWEDFFRNL